MWCCLIQRAYMFDKTLRCRPTERTTIIILLLVIRLVLLLSVKVMVMLPLLLLLFPLPVTLLPTLSLKLNLMRWCLLSLRCINEERRSEG